MTILQSCKFFLISAMGALFLSSTANANLITNGGFEDNSPSTALGGGGGWKFYEANDLLGWDGSNIELWGTHGIDSYEGDFHAELNAHGQRGGVWSISQTFDTVAGQTYDLFFAYGARLSNTNGSNEAFSVQVDDLYYVLDDHVVGDWNTYSDSFIADDSSATLTFTSISQHRWTYGNFLDDIRVSAVPEPNMLALLLLSLGGLIVVRKNK